MIVNLQIETRFWRKILKTILDMEFEVFMQHMRMDGISKNNKKHVTELKETDYKLEDKLESVKDTINKIGTTVLVAQRKMIDFKN